MGDILKKVDGLLHELSVQAVILKTREADLSTEIEKLNHLHGAKIDRVRNSIASTEKELLNLIKEHKTVLFKCDDERIDLDHGALLYSKTRRVKKIRNMLKKLKDQNCTDAIKTSESVNWDEIDKWPDSKLEEFGTRRIEKENFEYELNQ